MNSGDFRQPAGEQTLSDDIADDLGAKAPTSAQPAFKWTDLKKTQERSVILKFATSRSPLRDVSAGSSVVDQAAVVN